MKTIAFDLRKDEQLDNLSAKIGKEKIELGKEKFQLILFSETAISGPLYASFLLLLAKYFSKEKNKRMYLKEPDIRYHDEQNKSYYEIYIENNDVAKLENIIEKDFKIDIQLEEKNSINDVFGIWKDQNIDLDNIRKMAWQRTK